MADPVPTNVSVTLKGISQKSPANTSMPGEMASATNVQVLKGSPRGVEFSKRYGSVALTVTTDSSSTATNPRHMATLGDSLVMDNDQAVFTRDLALNAWVTRPRNGFNFTSSTGVISQSLYQKIAPAYAYDATTGNELIAWFDQADRVRYSVRGRALGDWPVHETVNLAASNFVATYKVQAFAPGDGFFYVLAPASSAGQLAITRISCANPGAAASNFFLTYDVITSQWDAQLTPEGNILLAMRNPSATSTTVAIWSPATTTVTASSSIATAALGNAAWLSQDPFGSGASRRYYLATADVTNGVLVWTFDGSLTSLGSMVKDASHATDIRANMAGWWDAAHSTARVFYDTQTPGLFSIYELGARYLLKVVLASKAFAIGGTWYVLTRFDSVTQSSLFLLDLANKRVVGKVGLEGAQWQNYLYAPGFIPWVTQIGTKTVIPVMAAHTALGQLSSTPFGVQIQGVSLVTFDSVGATSGPVELGGVLHFPGSIPWIFDGATSVESGFNVYPEFLSPADAGSGTSKTPGATYGYRQTFSWRDAVGNAYESAPSPVILYRAVNGNDLNIALSTLTLTNRTDVMLNLYRNDPAQPSVFRLVNSAAVANDTTSTFVTVLDSLSDLAISTDWATRALLYNGDGGASGNTVEVEHLPPPSHTISWTAQNRTFLAGIDQDPSAVWFSNEVTPTAGVSYFDGFVFRVVGEITAGVGRDRNVVIFTSESIWTVTGEFPDATGGSTSIPTPFKLPHALGAINTASIVVSSIGIFFQSKKGLHILSWDWAVTYIGSDVEDTLGSTTITSGVEVPSLHQVRLYTAAGNTLVWDTVFNLWTTFSGQTALAACNWRDVPCYIGADGIVHQEAANTYGDDGSFITSTLEFAIMSPADLRGYFCLFALQLLGRVLGGITLNASLAYNSQNVAITTYQRAIATPTEDGDTVLHPEIRPKKRQVAAYQLTVWDSPLGLSVASQGFTLEAITARIGVLPGLGRTRPTQRMGQV